MRSSACFTTSASPHQSAVRGDWGDDALAQLAANELCDRLYFSDAEMLMFSCMMCSGAACRCCFVVSRRGRRITTVGLEGLAYDDRRFEPATFRSVGRLGQRAGHRRCSRGCADGWGAHYKLWFIRFSSPRSAVIACSRLFHKIRHPRHPRQGDSTHRNHNGRPSTKRSARKTTRSLFFNTSSY